MGDATKLALAEVLFKNIHGGDRRREAADPGNLAAIYVLGWYEVFLFQVSRKFEERHVLLGERPSTSRIDFREKFVDFVARVHFVLSSSLTIVSLTRHWIGVSDARPPGGFRTIASTFLLMTDPTRSLIGYTPLAHTFAHILDVISRE